MACRIRYAAGLMTVMGLLGIPGKATANPVEPLTIVLVVVNEGEVHETVLARAKAEAARTYRLLGITLVWSRTIEYSGPPRLLVNIVSKPNDVSTLRHELAAKSAHAGVLGVAPGHQDRRDLAVWAFYARIQDTAAMLGLDSGVLLGHVIAHELGHLLLPYDSHSQTGIMRAGWDKAQATNAVMGTLAFDGGQSALIRRSVARLTAK